jgi:hypothetical protein
MFAAPKTADLVPDGPTVPVSPKEDAPLKGDQMKEIPLEVIEVKIDDIIKTEGHIKNDSVNSDSPFLESDSKPSIKGKEVKKEKKIDATPTPPENDVSKKIKDADASKFKGPNVHIGCRVSNEMKDAIEDMAKDFAYLARKEYGLKIKDDCSSIQRAFLILGMNCFTEKIRHKILQEYDNESLMQDEVSEQLLALMRIHKVEIDDIDF